MTGQLNPFHIDTPSVHCFLQAKALSMTDQFSLPNTQYMISTMATMGFYSRPLLDVCSKTIKGQNQYREPEKLYFTYEKTMFYQHAVPLWFLFHVSLVENLQGVPFNRLFTVLQSCWELHYRDFELLSSISDYVASTIDIWTKKQVLQNTTVY